MIAGESFVYFGPEQWHSMWRNRHQLLSRLARANRVVYVEPRPYDYEVAGALRHGDLSLDGLREGGLTPEHENLWIYRSPRYAPVGGPAPLRAVTHTLRRAHLRRALAGVGIDHPITWLSTPAQFDARRDLDASLKVYHIVDDYLGYHDLTPGQRVSWASRERELIAWAELVVTVSPELMAGKGAGNPKFRLLPNAVDAEAYGSPVGPLPEPLQPLPRPILGYVGLVSVRLDLALLDTLAVRRPDWTFVLMGTVYRSGCEAELDRLAERPNVRLLPAVPSGEVPPYVQGFDLGLVPYRVTQETTHASPLKVYEYLAAGLPVVAAAVPGAEQFGQVVSIAHGAEEWEAAIELGLQQRSEVAIAARKAAVAAHTWAARVETLSAYLEEALCGRPPAAGGMGGA